MPKLIVKSGQLIVMPKLIVKSGAAAQVDVDAQVDCAANKNNEQREKPLTSEQQSINKKH